jgi:anhydro-N-acetylmuramic acid kinase
VAVDFCGPQPRVVAAARLHYPDTLAERLSALVASGGRTNLKSLLEIDHQVAIAFGETANDLLAQLPEEYVVKAIGSHGQTVYHLPDGEHPNTLQLGDPSLIAEVTGITTIADWRRRDMAAGGQGAPLTPAFHFAFLQAETDVAILNLGGIANLTIIPAKGSSHPALGFDTGPANTLLDGWTARHCNHPFDVDGRWAASGHIDQALLTRMLSTPYFSRQAPKSTGREYFNMDWLADLLAQGKRKLEPKDVAATLVELTVQSVVSAVNELADQHPISVLYVCGGGIHNRHMMKRFGELLAPIKVTSSADAGIAPDQMEAMAFAWFAKKTLALEPIDTSPFTGAGAPRILGGIFHA